MNNYENHEFYTQIDVKQITESTVLCNLYTGVLCSEICMKREDYDYLLAKGFFNHTAKDGKADSSGIISTTEVYTANLAVSS